MDQVEQRFLGTALHKDMRYGLGMQIPCWLGQDECIRWNSENAPPIILKGKGRFSQVFYGSGIVKSPHVFFHCHKGFKLWCR